MNATTQTTPAATVNDVYAKALARARKSGVRILGRGKRKSDNAPIVAVSSAREPNRYHVVVIDRDCMYCDCYAGRRGVLCKHEAAVSELLIREWRARRDEIEQREEAALRTALLELQECHRVIDAARARRQGDAAPAITQDTAAHLLQRGISARRRVVADVVYPDGVPASDVVRGHWDNRPVTIWK